MGLETSLVRIRGQGGKVVFASGRFDPPCREVLRLLREARELGDLLVVGLLSGVREPGPFARPVLPLEDRAGLLGSLRFVDHVLVLDVEPPEDAARRLGADIFVPEGGAHGGKNGSGVEPVVVTLRPEGSSSATAAPGNETAVNSEGGNTAESPAVASL